MKNSVSVFLLALVVATCTSCFFISDDDDGEARSPNSCDEVRVVYPNVPDDSCRWVRRVMRDFQPPIILPVATDTGGRMLAARILTDTGEVLFVSGSLPPYGFSVFGAADCEGTEARLLGNDMLEIRGQYCQRPPVDPNGYDLRFYLDSDLTIFEDPTSSRGRLTFSIETLNQSRREYRLLQESDFTLIGARQDTIARTISGQFLAKLSNRFDSTDTIELNSGRFDISY